MFVENQQRKKQEMNVKLKKIKKHEEYYKHREKYLQRAKLWAKNNTDKYKKYKAEYQKKNKDKIAKYKKEYSINLKWQIIEYYSHEKNSCANCGLEDFKNLTIDHINGGGIKHRALVGKNIYKWLRDNDYPSGYQVLCFGCNLAKGKKSLDKIKINISLLKQRVINYYSHGENKCANCDLTDFKNLTIDHINGGGTKQRKELNFRGGIDFYRWLIKNNFPEGYQVLCWGCNNIKKTK